MAQVIGSMELVLQANLTKFTAAMDGASSALTKIASQHEKTGSVAERSASKIGTAYSAIKTTILGTTAAVVALGAASVFAAYKALQSFSNVSEEIDKLGKTAKRLGIGVGELSVLKFAAGEAGIEFESLAKMAGKSQRVIAEMVSKGDAIASIGGLNIALTDANGQVRSFTDILPDLATGIEGLGSSADQLRIAEKFFGKGGGEQFVTLLKDSGNFVENLARQTERAKRLNAIFTDDQVDKLTEYNDAVGRIGTAWFGLKVILATKVAPALTDIANKAASALAGVPQIFDNIMKVFQDGKVGDNARRSWELVGAMIKRILYDAIVLGGKFAVDTFSAYTSARMAIAFEDINPLKFTPEGTIESRMKAKLAKIDPEYGKRWENYVSNLAEGSKYLMIQLDTITGFSKIVEAKSMDSNLDFVGPKLQVVKEKISELNVLVGDFASQASKGIYGFASNLSDAFTEATYGAKISFESIATSFAKMLQSMALKVLVFEPILRAAGIAFSGIFGEGKDPKTSSSGHGPPVENARGGVWQSGRVKAFAAGGVVGGPTYFPMANGGTGLMGERGAEAIMPLAKTSAGLGVHAIPSEVSVVIIDQRGSGAQPEVSQSAGPDGRKQISVLIRDEVRSGLADGSFDRQLRDGFGVSRNARR